MKIKAELVGIKISDKNGDILIERDFTSMLRLRKYIEKNNLTEDKVIEALEWYFKK